ncbi:MULTISPECIES: hypothetical protein [unclassified Sutcliffiella]|uniref:hypothetical protein n=1 Tax=unclassified Sutcliffiella TaxID=2837532 RepID=UPI0030D49277
MEYQQSDFSNELLNKIRKNEMMLQSHMRELLKKYKPIFIKRALELDISFFREGEDPFKPGYNSFINIGVAEKGEEAFSLHSLNIWECNRYFLGMPISKRIMGSKVTGELIDEPVKAVKEEWEEFLEDCLIEE